MHFRKFKPINGESLFELFIRAQEFIDFLIRKHFDCIFQKDFEKIKLNLNDTKVKKSESL